jgi:hypothetical protein
MVSPALRLEKVLIKIFHSEKYDDLKLPTRVLVELNPRDMVSFLRVQSMAQNPRIKVAVSLQKRLSSLITCINARWKNSEAVVVTRI